MENNNSGDNTDSRETTGTLAEKMAGQCEPEFNFCFVPIGQDCQHTKTFFVFNHSRERPKGLKIFAFSPELPA